MRARRYSPQLSTLVLRALFFEGKARRKPMTRLADELLRTALKGTDGMRVALETIGSKELASEGD